MKMTYDPEVDALYIELRDVPIAESVDLEEGVTLDVDAEGKPVGLEILGARDHLELLTETGVDAGETAAHIAPVSYHGASRAQE